MAIDLQLTDRVLSEKATRKQLLKNAKIDGCEREMLIIFTKIDNLMRCATTDKERKDIAKAGVIEIYKLLGAGGELYIDGECVYRDTYSMT